MNIQCESCGSEHELDPPAWVLSSGRPFRFRCSVCGHSQMAEPPTAIGLPEGASHEPPEPRTVSPDTSGGQGPTLSTPTAPTPAPVTDATPSQPEGESGAEADSVFLKQDGKVYLVRDWATLQRWIMERRVGREDLVSEGGVRWEPIGGRPELGSFFAAVEQLEAAELAGLRGGDTPFPTEGEWADDEADRAAPSGLARLDDETEGVPLGLPPLPTEDLEDDGGGGEAWPEQPPSRLSAATPAPDEDPAPLVDPTPSMPFFGEDDLLGEPVAVEPEAPAPAAADDEAPVPARGEPAVDDEAPVPDDEAPVPDDEAPVPDDEAPVPDDEAPGLLVEDEDEMVSLDDEFAAEPADDAPSVADEAPEGPEIDDREASADAAFFGADVFDDAGSMLDEGEPEAEAEERPDTDEVDPDDPFRDFSDFDATPAEPEPEIVVQRGPSTPLLLGAAIVATLIAALGFFTAYNAGWFDAATPPVEPSTPAATTPERPPTPPEEPPALPADTDVADTDATDTDTDAVDTDVADTDAADTDDAVAEAPAEEPPAEEPPAEEPPAAASPRPAPAPASSSVSLAQLRSRGWAALDGGRVQSAIDTFERAVAQSPSDAEANYGLGFSYLQASQPGKARGPLCKALANAGGNVAITRDVSAFLEQNSLSCP